MIFKPTNPVKVAEAHLYEARRMILEHANAAEYHDAMRVMLAERIARLQSLLASQKDPK